MLPPSFFLLSILLGSTLIAGTKVRRIPRRMRYLLLGAFCIRVLYIAVDSVLRIFAGGGDFPLYDEALWYVARQWRVGDLLAPFMFLDGDFFLTVYTYVYASVYALFGHHPSLVRLLVTMTGVLFIYNVYRITRRIDDHRSGMYAAGFAAIYPYWIQLSGIFYRDMLVMLLLTEIMYLLLRWTDTGGYRIVVLTACVTVVALSLRPINVVPIGATVAVATYVKLDSSRWQKPIAATVLIVGLATAMVIFGDSITVRELADRRAWLARESNAAYLTNAIYANIAELLAFLPVGSAYFFLVPFPWQLVNTLAVVALLQNVFLWYPAVFLSIFGIRRLVPERTDDAIILLTFLASGVMIYGLVEGNIGPAMRHRSQFQFISIVLASISLAKRVRLRIGVNP